MHVRDKMYDMTRLHLLSSVNLFSKESLKVVNINETDLTNAVFLHECDELGLSEVVWWIGLFLQ